MRRRIRERPISSFATRPTQLWRDNRFLWAAGLIFSMTLLFGVVTAALMNRGYTQIPAMRYGMLVTSVTATILQLTNLWRGRLLTTVLQFLWVITTSNSKPEESSGEQSQPDTDDLLKGITCSCKKKEQTVGVCHHCGRFVCENCGYAIEDKRFTLPGKPIWKREPAWHCLKCLRKYHESEWRWHWFLKKLGVNRKSKLS